jgi:tryptophanyl-tRNA synthetase
MDLQAPSDKMSTSSDSPAGTIYVTDEPKVIEKKIKSAVTDSGKEVVRGRGKEGITNLLEILAAVRGTTIETIEAEFADAPGYGVFKQAVADAVIEYLTPVRERYAQLRADEAELERILVLGAEKAQPIAAETLAGTREAMGFGAVRPSS